MSKILKREGDKLVNLSFKKRKLDNEICYKCLDIKSETDLFCMLQECNKCQGIYCICCIMGCMTCGKIKCENCFFIKPVKIIHTIICELCKECTCRKCLIKCESEFNCGKYICRLCMKGKKACPDCDFQLEQLKKV